MPGNKKGVVPMADGLEKAAIQWHPGFYGAAEIELVSNKGELEFQREYNLSKEPLRMDLLIIKKRKDVPIENEIGHIFKRYNVVEYKSPEDRLSIDDYYKTVGYACLYKGLGDTVNQIPEGELTLSIFREGYPRELFEALERSGRTLEEHAPGIYYIRGNVLFDTQIVVTGRLSQEAHSGLRILSKNAQEADIRTFITKTRCLTEQGDRNNVDAVLQVSVSANEGVYQRIRRDYSMCEALRELMKDEIAETVAEAVAEAVEKERAKALAEGQEKGIEKGIEKGTDNALLSSIINLMDTMKWTAEQAMDAIKIPSADRGKYMSRL